MSRVGAEEHSTKDYRCATAAALGLGLGLGLLGGGLATAPYYAAPYYAAPGLRICACSSRTYRYWCDPYQQYYPYVPNCPTAWRQVLQ
jgi:hypothetical protein